MNRLGILPEVLPGETGALLTALDRAFPNRCIQPGESKEDALFYAGKRALIDTLLVRFNKAVEN